MTSSVSLSGLFPAFCHYVGTLSMTTGVLWVQTVEVSAGPRLREADPAVMKQPGMVWDVVKSPRRYNRPL